VYSHHHQFIRVAANRSITTIVGGNPDDRARLRHALLPRLDRAPATLRDTAAGCLSRVLARDLVLDEDYVQLFQLFANDDPRIRAPVIAELWSFIQASDETVRRRIVDADILSAILRADSHDKDDLILFISDCVLPLLGPTFNQDVAGSTVIPLLDHKEPRISTAAAAAFGSIVDSQHDNVELLTRTGTISNLQPTMDGEDVVRHLWCHLLPKAAPFLSAQAEVDILFESLGYAILLNEYHI
jgi:hypothetical protein